MMKKLISILLAVLLIAVLSCTAFAETGIGVEPGQAMPDFTVSLTDGKTATLSELLKDKDLVVLNIFASWCGPCEREFPEMETVYQANSDRMVILSVSGDPDDTMEILSAYKDSHSLSFPMGLAGDALDFLTIPGFPTSIFIDRGGNVGFVKVGAFANQEDFEGKVNTFLSADYNGQPLASEVAHSITPYLLGLLALSAFGGLFLIIGRWCLLRKAGKPGWHSLIPFLSTYKEYSIWKFAASGIGCLIITDPERNIVYQNGTVGLASSPNSARLPSLPAARSVSKVSFDMLCRLLDS